MQTPEFVVRAFCACWAAGDIVGAMAHIGDDAVYTLYLSEDLVPFAGEVKGRDAIEASLREMRRQFDYLVYRPYNLVEDADVVRHRVEFIYRHRASGEVLSGNFRIAFTIRDGKISRGEEYHDRPMVEAFFRLLSAKA